MTDCNFNIGDRVKNNGICGEIKEITPMGSGFILTVSVDGEIFNWDCEQVEPC